MVRLVYHSHIFGPISLEYQQPVVTVGCESGNDLVLPHPSVRPCHCQLVMQEESVILCPLPGEPVENLGNNGERREFFVGDQLVIGEVLFEVRHSSNTVAIPCLGASAPETAPAAPNGSLTAAIASAANAVAPVPAMEGSAEGQYYCSNCQAFFSDAIVTRIGLKGRQKHLLCPQCSRPVESAPAPEKPPAGFFAWLAARFRDWAGFFQRHSL